MKTTAASLIIAICCSGSQAFCQELTPTLQLSDDFQQRQEQNSVPPRSSAAFSGGTINGLEINSLPATVTIDLGKIPKDITAKFTVEFKNSSSTDIQVDTVTSGCGCLVGRDFPKQVKQSEIGQFDLYVTSTKTGSYQKRLLVNAATLDRTINFLVKAECVDLLSVAPIVLELEEGKNCELHVAGNFL